MDFDTLIREQEELLAHKVMSRKDILANVKEQKRMTTDEERSTLERLKTEAESHAARIKELKAEQKRWNDIESDSAQLEQIAEPTEVRSAVQKATKEQPRVEVPFQGRNVRAFDGVYEKRSDKELAAYTTGCFLVSAMANQNGKYDKEARWLKDAGINVRALAEGTSTAGGFLVPTMTEAGVIDNREQYGVFRRYAQVSTLGAEQTNVPAKDGSTTAAFVDENGTFSESDQSWKNVEVIPKKAGYLTRMSAELVADAIIDLGNDFTMEAGRSLAFLEDTTGFAGLGTPAHGSIMGVATLFNNDNTLAGAVDLESGDNTFAEMTIIGIEGVMAALPEYASTNAAIYCSRACLHNGFNRLKGTAGGNTAQSLDASFGMNYNGIPIRITQVLPNTPGADLENSTMFLYGDLAAAAILGQRSGIEIAASEHRYFDQGQIAYRVSQRFRVVVHDVGDASTAGPIVAGIGA